MAERNREDVEGYIHEVSEVKTPSSGNRYFDFKIQARDVNRRVVCFSPDKRQDIKENEEKKSPVKIYNVSPKKRKFDPENIEYIMNNRSKVIRTKNISFPWSEPVGAQGPLSISDLRESSLTGDVVSVEAKVIWKGQTERIYSHALRKDLDKCQLILADASAAIEATIWENMVPNVSEGESYVFEKFKVAYFNKKFVNGTPESLIKDTKVVELPPEVSAAAEEMIPKTKEAENVTGRVLAVDVSFAHVCLCCKNRIPESTEKFIDCGSCNTTSMREEMKKSVTATVLIVDENGENKGRFYCSAPVLNGMFTSVKETQHYNIEDTDASQLSRKMIVETLLQVKKVDFRLSIDDKVVQNMEVSW